MPASNSTAMARGRAIHCGQNSVRKTDTPIATGSAIMSDSRAVIRVPTMGVAAP